MRNLINPICLLTYSFFISSLNLFFYTDYLVSANEVTISEKFTLDSKIKDIQWAGLNYTNVFILTISLQIYQSSDSGRTWAEITSLLSTEDDIDNFAKAIKINSYNPQYAVIIGTRKKHLITRNGGESFEAFYTEGVVENLIYHPSEPNKFLFSELSSGCTAQKSKHSSNCFRSLLYSQDYGKTKNLVSSYVVQFSWGDLAHNTENYIYLTKFRHAEQDQPINVAWFMNVDFGVYRDNLYMFDLLVEGGNKFLISNGYMFVAKVKSSVDQTVLLYVSTDGGKTFKQTKLPDKLTEKSYTILDVSENSVMLHINHGFTHKQNTAVGNVYISDSKGEVFSLSLKNIIRGSNGECEIEAVGSLESVFIANFINNTCENSDSYPYIDSQGSDTLEIADLNPKHNLDLEKPVKTVITFDNGAFWSYLKPPKIDSLGKKISCANETNNSYSKSCSLNLHGITQFSQFAPFYSSKSAVGLIMGTGNVGPYLSFSSEDINTYLSRDGGLNWVEAHKGAHIYEYGDHGGLIIMANSMKPTEEIIFSWDEGNTWYDFNLGGNSLRVENIVIEPNSSSIEFLMYGEENLKTVIYHIDFSSLKQPLCKGASTPDSVSSDYETWSPSDGVSNSNCLMGKELIFTRRKPSAQCFNGRDFKRDITKNICDCTERDFECNFGFTRHINGFECKVQHAKFVQENCTNSPVFYADAYRKIPGNACENGWKPPKTPIRCSSMTLVNRKSKQFLKVVQIFLVILGLLILLNCKTTIYRLGDISSFKFYENNYSLTKTEDQNVPQSSKTKFYEKPENYGIQQTSSTNTVIYNDVESNSLKNNDDKTPLVDINKNFANLYPIES